MVDKALTPIMTSPPAVHPTQSTNPIPVVATSTDISIQVHSVGQVSSSEQSSTMLPIHKGITENKNENDDDKDMCSTDSKDFKGRLDKKHTTLNLKLGFSSI